jgi:hypothetical protein
MLVAEPSPAPRIAPTVIAQHEFYNGADVGSQAIPQAATALIRIAVACRPI